MTKSLQINSTAEAQSLMEETKAIQQTEREAAKAAPQIKLHGGFNGSIQHSGGKMSLRTGRTSSANTSVSDLKHGEVRLAVGGEEMTTDYASAVAAGLEDAIVEYGRGLPSQDAREAKLDEVLRQMRKQELERNPPTEIEQPKQAAKTDEAKKVDLPDATDAEKVAINKAGEIITTLTQQLGASAVESMQTDVVSSGQLPTEADLPPSVSMEQVQTIVDAYTHQANSVVRSVPGANVALMMETLNENELKQARQAVYQHNDAALRDLAYVAVSRLQQLPENDPAAMKRLTASWPQEVNVVRREGRYWVQTPKWSMPWSDAVASGKIKMK